MGVSVSILIVNYRSTDLLRRCLSSIQGSSVFGQTETIVVDNASPHFDADELRDMYPWAAVLPQSTNLTFTAGNNLAFTHANGDHILLLNPDTELEPGTLEAALGHLRDQPELAAVGGYLLNEDGSLQRYYRRLPTIGDVPVMLLGRLMSHTPRGRRYHMLDASLSGATAVEQPPGAFLLVPRRRVAGTLLHPEFFNYGSDVELCAQLGRQGPIMVFDDVRLKHRRGAAGVVASDFAERLRLWHDLTWAMRHLFETTSRPGRLYLEWWLWIFWLLRIAQTVVRGPLTLRLGISTARRALGRVPPTYDS